MTHAIELGVCVFLPIYRPAKPCTFGDNVSALKLAGLSQVFQEALIRLLSNNGINYFKRHIQTY